MEEQKAVATQGQRAIASIGAEAPMDFKGQDTGFQEVTSECLALPYMRIGQTSGDFMKRGSPKFILGLQGGDFFCPMTQEVFGQEINLVVVKFYRSFAIYESKETTAKFLGTITPENYETEIEPHTTREKSYTLDPQGHRYVDQRNFVVVDYDHPERGPMLFSMSSTGIKPSKAWLTQATNIKARKQELDAEGNVIDEWLEEAPIWSSVWAVRTAYFDDPRGGYYQVAQTRRLGWVKKGRMADSYKKIFESMKGYDATQISALDDEPAGESEVPVAERTMAGKPEDPAVAAVAGAMNSRPARQSADEDPEIF
jgi:hypothetical protein